MGIREASYAMGATKWQTIYKVVLPAAKLGIVDALSLIHIEMCIRDRS